MLEFTASAIFQKLLGRIGIVKCSQTHIPKSTLAVEEIHIVAKIQSRFGQVAHHFAHERSVVLVDDAFELVR